MNDVYLGLGTNLGDRIQNLEMALQRIGALGEVVKKSSAYESEAWGYEDPNPYLNMACIVRTSLAPIELHRGLVRVENEVGRKERRSNPDDPYTSRVIDIDILFYNGRIVEEKDLIIPHPRLHLRNFVLKPLFDLNPDLIHPVLLKTIRELCQESPDESEIHRLKL